MSWAKMEVQWKQAAMKAKEQWGELTHYDVTVIDGKRDQLIGKLQEKYGIAKDEAERQVNDFAATHFPTDQAKASNKGF